MWVGVLVALLSLPAVASADVSSVTVYGSTTTVRPDQALPPGGVPGATGPSLRAARNEFESFQVVIEATSPLKDLSIGRTGLAGPGGATIPEGHMTVYREVPYRVGGSGSGSSNARVVRRCPLCGITARIPGGGPR